METFRDLKFLSGAQNSARKVFSPGVFSPSLLEVSGNVIK